MRPVALPMIPAPAMTILYRSVMAPSTPASRWLFRPAPRPPPKPRHPSTRLERGSTNRAGRAPADRLPGGGSAVAPGLLGDVHGRVGQAQEGALHLFEGEVVRQVAFQGGHADGAGQPLQVEGVGLDVAWPVAEGGLHDLG